MSDTPRSAHDRVFDPHPARAAMPAPKFNRDLNELRELAEELSEKLDAFAEAHDSGALANELISVGALTPEE
jgi:hypothetical protein